MNDGAPGIATLVPFIPGDELEPEELGHISTCGAALAELHRALAVIEPPPPLVSGRRYGPLDEVDPSGPTPEALIESLWLPEATRSRIVDLVEAVDLVHVELLPTLPAQIIHADYDASNVLLRHGRVTAIMDFEFAWVGPRAMDIAVGLWSFVVESRERRDPWPAAASFLRAHRRSETLTPEEMTALPALLLIREVTSLLHWGGRFRRGLTTEADLVCRAEALLRLADWLELHGDRIVDAARFTATR